MVRFTIDMDSPNKYHFKVFNKGICAMLYCNNMRREIECYENVYIISMDNSNNIISGYVIDGGDIIR